MLKIILTRSLIGCKEDQRLTARALGLGRVGSVVYHNDNGPIRGMLHKLHHVLTVEMIDDSAAPARPKTRRRSATAGQKENKS